MKKIFLSVFMGMSFLCLLTPAFAISNSSVPVPSDPAKPENVFNAMLVQQFLKLTPQKYYEMTGKKMKLSQKISLKLGQWKVKRMLKKGKKVDLMAMSQKGIDTSDFNIAGFLLGFFLSLIGVLIAYLINDEAIIKWAWLGAGLSAIIWLLFIIL